VKFTASHPPQFYFPPIEVMDGRDSLRCATACRGHDAAWK